MHIYQILNHYTRREELDPGFGVLDNSSNRAARLVRVLADQKISAAAKHWMRMHTTAFCRRSSGSRPGLSSAAVREFVLAGGAAADVVLFSPSIHNSAYFLNVFEHGDAEHPGLKEVAAAAVRASRSCRAIWTTLVSDSRNTVHSNYFIAKPRFWRAWLSINERLFTIAEAPDDPLGGALRAPAPYRGALSVQMKIFVMERVATWLLMTDRSFTARVHDPFVARSRIYKLPLALVCDALKIAYATAGPHAVPRCIPAGSRIAPFLEFSGPDRRRAVGIRQVEANLARSEILLAGREVAMEFWHGRRVLLTGHTGFKGAWMSLWLRRLGARVTGLGIAARDRSQSVDNDRRRPCAGAESLALGDRRHPRCGARRRQRWRGPIRRS